MKKIAFQTHLSPKDAEALTLAHQLYKADGVSMSELIAAAIKLYVKERIKPEDYTRIYGLGLLDRPLLNKTPKDD